MARTSRVERVALDALGESGPDGSGRRTARLAISLPLERGEKLLHKPEPRVPLQHRHTEVARPALRIAPGDVESRAFAEQVALDVEGGIDLVPHMTYVDLVDPHPPLH